VGESLRQKWLGVLSGLHEKHTRNSS
jgi:hypothetical protein